MKNSIFFKEVNLAKKIFFYLPFYLLHKNILYSLKKNGILVFGCPSIESQKYASKLSKKGHVNCKNKIDLKRIMLIYFNCVLMFSMNDEVVHTGYDKMSHYIFAICTNKKIL